jgi:hypothetical protein
LGCGLGGFSCTIVTGLPDSCCLVAHSSCFCL